MSYELKPIYYSIPYTKVEKIAKIKIKIKGGLIIFIVSLFLLFSYGKLYTLYLYQKRLFSKANTLEEELNETNQKLFIRYQKITNLSNIENIAKTKLNLIKPQKVIIVE